MGRFDWMDWVEALGENTFLRVILWLIALAVTVGACVSEAHAQIPSFAQQHRQQYQRIVRSEWGLNAPIASLAAQIHQESGWDCRAVSRVGARGCAQFMPATATWIGDVDKTLKAGDVFSPAWAFRAQAVYMKWLHARIKASDGCNQMAFAMQAYNSGLGWVFRRQKSSRSPGVCFGLTCKINPGVTPANQREAEEYPERILHRLEPAYVSWGRRSCT